MVELAQRELPAVPVGREVHILWRRRAIGRCLASLRSRGLRGSTPSGGRLRAMEGRWADRSLLRGLRSGTAGKDSSAVEGASSGCCHPCHSKGQA